MEVAKGCGEVLVDQLTVSKPDVEGKNERLFTRIVEGSKYPKPKRRRYAVG